MTDDYNKELISFQKDKRLDYIYDLHDVVVQESDIPKLKFSKYTHNDVIGKNVEFRGIYVRIPKDVNYATISYDNENDDAFNFNFHTKDRVSSYKMSINSDDFKQEGMFGKLDTYGGTVLSDTPKLLSDIFPQFDELQNHYKRFIQIMDFAKLYTESGIFNTKHINHLKKIVNVENTVNTGLSIQKQSEKQSQVELE